MKVNIGLDFGTTYSVISELACPENGDFTPKSVAIRFQESKDDNYYDTIVLNVGDELYYASEARDNIGKAEDYISYTGFKLLLAEKENSVLLRDYDKYKPRDIVERYLRYLLEAYTNKSRNTIGKLVIGVPYVWTLNTRENKCYSILLDIVTGLNIAEEIEFLSEPEAACGYWASMYKENHGGVNYEGQLLLIDYGGGTLDICLCDIGIDEKGDPQIDINPKKRSGAGANTNGEIGQAGQAFMKKVIKYSLLDAGAEDKEIETFQRTGKIDQGVHNLEGYLKQFDTEFKKAYEKFGNYFSKVDRDSLKNIIRSNENRYKGNIFKTDSGEEKKVLVGRYKCIITYKNIAQAYLEEIYEVLNEELKERIIDAHNLDSTFDSDNFKVQLIGGFSNFLLVERQVKSILKPTTKENSDLDKRFIGGIPRGDKRTCAVAYGAALKANMKLSIPLKWDCYLGLKGQGQEHIWATEIGMDLSENKIYLVKKTGRKAAHIRGKELDTLYYAGVVDSIKNPPSVPMGKNVMLDTSATLGYVMGVSMNRYKIISFYWWKLQDMDGETFDKRMEEFEDDINSGKEIKEFDLRRSGKIEIGQLFDNLNGIDGR